MRRNFSTGLTLINKSRTPKKKAFLESITSGKFHNQADKGAESAISCMLARTAAYKSHEVTWDEMMNSTEVLDPRIDLNKLG
jgi:myo-inositol 2-dehydrogenase/D-chiro-inositol 1-dehydrogenase